MDRQSDFPYASGELSRLLNDIAIAAKVVSKDVRRAGLTENILGAEGNTNVQGEEVKKLDVLANDLFINMLRSSYTTCLMISEENEQVIEVETEKQVQI